MLGTDDEHVSTVAVGDDLLLQVLRRVLAAQVGLQRAAQARALLAQAIAAAVSTMARRIGTALRARRTAAPTLSIEARNVARARKCPGSSARPSTASPSTMTSRSAGACSDSWLSARNLTVSDVPASAAATLRGSVSGRSCARRTAPGGVRAKRRTASTIRSNSRALRAPACIWW
jgi:hypothetical protein